MNILIRGAKATRLKKPPHQAEGFFCQYGIDGVGFGFGRAPLHQTGIIAGCFFSEMGVCRPWDVSKERESEYRVETGVRV